MAVPEKGRFTCLLIEDDSAFAATAMDVVRQEGGQPTHCSNLAHARQVTASTTFDLILLDNHLPDGKGYDFFAHLTRRNPESPVIMITGIPDLSEAVILTRNGLFDYLTKPVSVDALAGAIGRALLRSRSRNPTPAGAADWFGDSDLMRGILEQIKQVARHPASTVLLTGETGTGKDVAARMVHGLTFCDKDAPFIAVNCAALPADMFEAELFGAERGAYTGADRRRTGLAAAASDGTLFLDEIGDVPLPLQPKLLRLLEAREFRALGSNEPQTFTGRFIAATNKSLVDEVKAGRFREDLWYRLDVFTVELPPLRQRRGDIPGLAELLLAQLARKYDRAKPLLKPDDLAAIANYDFPGNVRELRNLIERSLLKSPADERWLSLDLGWLERGTSRTPPPAQLRPQPATVPQLPEGRELTPIEAQEYRLIREALLDAKGGIRRAASRLGMSPQALLRRLEKWPELRVDQS